MRWLQTEYLLKGIFLGLLVYAALGQAAVPPAEGAESLLRVNLPALGGLALALLVAAVLKRRQGYRARGRPVVFLLFLLLESPTLVYLGIIGGTFAGTLLLPQPDAEGLLLPTVGGGAALGLVFGLLRQVRHSFEYYAAPDVTAQLVRTRAGRIETSRPARRCRKPKVVPCALR